MKLSRLLKTIKPVRVNGMKAERLDHDGVSNPEIGSIHYQSKSVKPDGLFVAIEGFAADGHDFIDEALQKGAKVVVTQRPVQKESVVIEVEDTRIALAALAAQFYGKPSEHLILIGITGTNGKTTTAYLVESILSNAGFKVGVLGDGFKLGPVGSFQGTKGPLKLNSGVLIGLCFFSVGRCVAVEYSKTTDHKRNNKSNSKGSFHSSPPEG